MYIVNYHEGWELLSGDRRISKVLAMCESGNLHESDMQGNPVLSDLLATAKHQISLSLGNSISPIDNGTDTWNTAYPPASEGWICLGSQVLSHNSGVQDHLTTTKWGQQYPWNIKAPYTSQLKKNHCYTGCVMVASSQILYYLHQKENDPISTYSDCIDNASIGNGKAYISINDSDVQYFSKNSTEWDTMPLDSSESENNYRGVSTLMTRLGHLLNAVYFRDKTGAINSNIPSVLQSEYNVSCKYSSSADYSIIKNQIMTLKKPVIIGLNSAGGGHTAIIDGYYWDNAHTRLTFYKRGSNPPEYKYYDSYTNLDFVAINWGYDGKDMTESGGTIWYNIKANFPCNADGNTYSSDDMVYGFTYNK